MSRQALLQHVAQPSLKRVMPELKPGQTVKVSQKIVEGAKERIQMFEGLIIAMSNGTGINGTFTVRKIVGGIGVEKIFPLHGSTVTKVQVVKEGKVRRAKLYYMRDLQGKAARLRGTNLEGVVFDEEAAKKEEAEKAKAVAELEAKTEAEEKEKADAAAAKQTEETKEETPAEEAAPTKETKEEAPAQEEAKVEEPAVEAEKKD